VKGNDLSAASFLGRVCESFVIRLPSQHSSPRRHIVVSSVRIGSASGRFTPLAGMSPLTFRRATNPRTGNDWQPFRSRHGLVAGSVRGTLSRDESNFEAEGAFLPTLPRLSDF